MGICVSSQYTRKGIRSTNLPHTTKIIHLEDGKLQELRHLVKACQILSQQNQECFLCSLESINIDKTAPQVPENEELQLGQIYFLMPLSHYSKSPLSLQDVCVLAIKASKVLSQSNSRYNHQPSRCCLILQIEIALLGLRK